MLIKEVHEWDYETEEYTETTQESLNWPLMVQTLIGSMLSGFIILTHHIVSKNFWMISLETVTLKSCLNLLRVISLKYTLSLLPQFYSTEYRIFSYFGDLEESFVNWILCLLAILYFYKEETHPLQ